MVNYSILNKAALKYIVLSYIISFEKHGWEVGANYVVSHPKQIMPKNEQK